MGNVAFSRLHFPAVTPKLKLQSQSVPKEPVSLLAAQPGEPGGKADLKNRMKLGPFPLSNRFKENHNE